MNVSNVPVLPITKSISQCPGYPGNASASELEIGNIGTGNISTMATLNGRCWDGWNIIREIQWPVASGQWPVVTDNVWGLDLDGTPQGAGGVGGLLAVVRSDCAATNSPTHQLTNSPTHQLFFPTYDANGNISEYISTNGEIVAHYDYSPFGETLMQTGDLASTFTHRFSTKPWCPVTGLCEYQMRKYRPEIGRWLSRDPIGENGGFNFYVFCKNAPVRYTDAIGQKCIQLSDPIVDDSEWELFSYDLSEFSIPVPFYWQIRRVKATWILQGHVDCCCKFLWFSWKKRFPILRYYEKSESLDSPIFAIDPAHVPLTIPNPSSILEGVGAALGEAIKGALDKRFKVFFISEDDKLTISNKIKEMKPRSLDEGEWEASPCK